jgi:hypothetical protein
MTGKSRYLITRGVIVIGALVLLSSTPTARTAPSVVSVLEASTVREASPSDLPAD